MLPVELGRFARKMRQKRNRYLKKVLDVSIDHIEKPFIDHGASLWSMIEY